MQRIDDSCPFTAGIQCGDGAAALVARFRDTLSSDHQAELEDDLYAFGKIHCLDRLAHLDDAEVKKGCGVCASAVRAMVQG